MEAQVCKVCQAFAFEHKINKPTAKVSTQYQFKDLHPENISDKIFVVIKFFGFFWNVLNTKAIKVCRTTIIYIQSYRASSY